MALVVAREKDGLFHCPDEECAAVGRKYTKCSNLQRHCLDVQHPFSVTTIMPPSKEEKRRQQRDRMRAVRAAKAAAKSTQRPAMTSLDADERGVHGAAQPLVIYRESLIPGAGNGIFAVEPLFAGDVVAPYDGRIVTEIPSDPNYTIQFRSKGKYLDGLRIPKKGKGLGSFVNKESRDHRARKNCVLVQEGHKVYVEMVKDVQPGEELYTTYSHGYRLPRSIKPNC